MAYKSGTDLILSLNGKPMGYSSTCKISDSAETGDRRTKESGDTLFPERYVKSVTEHITTDGFVCTGSRTGYAQLKSLLITGTPVTLNYCFLGDETGYTGQFIITSLELDGPAGDDAKYSLAFDSTGPVKPASVTKQDRVSSTFGTPSEFTPPSPGG